MRRSGLFSNAKLATLTALCVLVCLMQTANAQPVPEPAPPEAPRKKTDAPDTKPGANETPKESEPKSPAAPKPNPEGEDKSKQEIQNALKKFIGSLDSEAQTSSKRVAEIKLLIKKLGSSDWSTREAARKSLIKIGDEALPLLEKAQKDRDIERAFRAKEIFEAIRWSVPEIYKRKLGQQFRDYGSLERNAKLAMFEFIRQLQPADLTQGASFITKVIRFDKDLEIKKRALTLYFRAVPQANPALDLPVLSSLLEFADDQQICQAAGSIALRAGKLDIALASSTHLLKVLKGQQSYPGQLATHVDILLKLKQFESARGYIEEQIKLAPNEIQPYLRLSAVNFELGKKDEARKALALVEKVIDVKGTPSNYLKLSEIYLKFGDLDKAHQSCRKGLIKAPFNHELNTQYALIDMRAGRTEKGFVRLLNELRYTQSNSESEKKIITALKSIFKSHKLEHLIESAGVIEDLRRGRPIVASHDQLARWLVDRGLDNLAVNELKFVSVLQPNSIEIRIRLAEALERTNRVGEAIDVYKQVIKLNDQFPLAKNRLKALQANPEKLKKKKLKTYSGIAFWEQIRRTQDQKDKSTLTVIHSANSCAPFKFRDSILESDWTYSALNCFDLESGKLKWSKKFELPKEIQDRIQQSAKPSAGDKTSPKSNLEKNNSGKKSEEAENVDNAPKLVAKNIASETVVMTIAPGLVAFHDDMLRALEPAPLFVVVRALWLRKEGELDWRKATYLGLFATLHEVDNGEIVAEFRIGDDEMPLSPFVGSGTQYYFIAPRSKTRRKICRLNLATRSVDTKVTLKFKTLRDLTLIGDQCLLQTRRSMSVFNADLSGKPIDLTDSGLISTINADRKVFLDRQDQLVQLDDKFKPQVLAKKISVRHDAGLGYYNNVAYCADRDGKIIALSLKTGKPLWTVQLEISATRRFYFDANYVYLVNGIDDSFPNEIPYFIGLDKKTGQLVWKRPIEIPVQVRIIRGHVIVKSGTGEDLLSSKLTVLNPSEKAERRSVALELRSAASDAFVGNSFEVSVLLFRLYREQLKAQKELAPIDDLILFGRMLARSNRFEDALTVLTEAEERAGEKQAKRFHEIKYELRLIAEPWPEEKPEDSDTDTEKEEDKDKDGKDQKDQKDKPKKEADKKSEEKTEKPKKDGNKPDTDKKDSKEDEKEF